MSSEADECVELLAGVGFSAGGARLLFDSIFCRSWPLSHIGGYATGPDTSVLSPERLNYRRRILMGTQISVS